MSSWEAAEGATNEWYTPAYVFEALGCRFDLDVAAPNGDCLVPADTFFNCDSLYVPWYGFVWMNPPFGGRGELLPWLERFFAHGNGLALTPDRSSAPWYRFAHSKADLVMSMPKVGFHRHDWTIGHSPGTGTCIWAAGSKAMAALLNASAGGYGILSVPFNRHEAMKVTTYKQRLKAQRRAA